MYNPTLEKQVHNLSKVGLSQEGETWLVRVISSIFITSIDELIDFSSIEPDWHEHNSEADEAAQECNRLKKASNAAPPEHIASEKQTTEANVETELDDPVKPSELEPLQINSSKSIFNHFKIEPIKSWIGKQLENQDISPTVLNIIIETHDNYPNGLLAIPSNKGSPPRLIVPVTAQENLIKQAHLDIHHQSHRKKHNILYPLYWWPRMNRDIERVCKACAHCQSCKMRREKIKSEFDALESQSKAGPPPALWHGLLWSSKRRNPCNCRSVHARNDLTMVTNQ